MLGRGRPCFQAQTAADGWTWRTGLLPVLNLDFQSVSPDLLWPYPYVQRSTEGLDDDFWAEQGCWQGDW
jgi:hypothetical protein